MQKVRRSLPTTLPLFFLNVEDAVNTRPRVNKSKKIVPENGKYYNIEYSTPTGRTKTLKAKFLSKDRNLIVYDRWTVKNRTTWIKHDSSVRVLSQV